MASPEQIIDECKELDIKGDLGDALKLLGNALREKPDAVLFYERGFRYEDLGDYESALADYSAAIQLQVSPKMLIARGGLLCHCLNQPRSGLEDFERALDLSPQSVVAHKHICLCYQLLDRKEEALKHAMWLVNHEPDDAEAHLCLGQCLLAESRFDIAIQELQIATRLDPSSSNAWSSLSRAFRKEHRLPEALTCLRKSIELKQSTSDLMSLASLLLELQEPEKATEILQSVRKFDLTEGQILLVNGFLNMAQGMLGVENSAS